LNPISEQIKRNSWRHVDYSYYVIDEAAAGGGGGGEV